MCLAECFYRSGSGMDSQCLPSLSITCFVFQALGVTTLKELKTEKCIFCTKLGIDTLISINIILSVFALLKECCTGKKYRASGLNKNHGRRLELMYIGDSRRIDEFRN